MTLERERESEKLKDECKKLQANYSNSEVFKCDNLSLLKEFWSVLSVTAL